MELKTARRIYAEGSDWVKTALEEEFGKDNLVKKDFTGIKTIEDARLAMGYDENYLEVRHLETTDEWAYRMLKMITKAINGKWVPEMGNKSQPKWYNWFVVLPSGVGFSFSRTRSNYVCTGLGSRLCFENEEKADFAREQFEDLYLKFNL